MTGNYYRIDRAAAVAKGFVTQMLTRDLFAVANLLVNIKMRKNISN